MTHENERICIIEHARHMIHATMHAHAHAECGPIPAAGVSMDTFFLTGNDRGRDARGPNVPAQSKESFTRTDAWLGVRPLPYPNAANTPEMERRQNKGNSAA
jgi:hypothetical protein